MTDKPRVNLEFRYMWCGKHLEPFRAGWPNNAGIAMLNLFAASAADERILAAADGITNRLEPVLREHGPMCCFLPAEVTQAVVEASLAGQKWKPAEPATPDIELAAEDTTTIQPCQPIGCDNGYHLAGCRFADIDAAEHSATEDQR